MDMILIFQLKNNMPTTRDKIKSLLQQKAARGNQTAASVLNKIADKGLLPRTLVNDPYTGQVNRFQDLAKPAQQQAPQQSSQQVMQPEPQVIKPQESKLDEYFALSPKNVSNTLAKTTKIGQVVGGFLGEKLGQVIGGVTGLTGGGLASGFKSPDKSIEGRLKYTLEQGKKAAKETGQVGRTIGSTGGGIIPAALKTTVDVGRFGIKVIAGKEEDFINMISDSFMQQLQGLPGITSDPGQITKEQAKNYLLTGNFKGDLNKIDKSEIVKAWYASLLPIGMDLWMASSIATSAYNGYYKANATKGWKPKATVQIDFEKGLATLVKDGKISTKSFTPAPNARGTFEATLGEPTLGRRLSQPITGAPGRVFIQDNRTPLELSEAGIAPEAGITPTQRALPGAAVKSQVETIPIRPQLATGEGVRTSLAPVDTPQAGFQIIDAKKAATVRSLTTKLKNQVAKKEALIKTGRATQDTVAEIKKMQATITTLENSLNKAKQNQIQTTGPIVDRTIKETTKSTVPITTSETPVVTKIVKETVKEPIQVVKPQVETKKPVEQQKTIQPKVTKLYHPSASGRLQIDKQGNINLGTSKEEIARFGEPIEFDVSDMKVLEFESKAALFDALKKKKNYQERGFDILKADNQAFAINPRKFAKAFNTQAFQRSRQQIGALQRRFEELGKARKEAGRPKSEGVTETKALKARIEFNKQQAKNKPKSYAEYRAQAEKNQVAKETPEQIRERLAKEKAEVAARRARGQYTSKEIELGINEKAKETKSAIYNELKELKKKGKDEVYFHELHNKYFLEFLEGKSKTDKSEIVSRFIDENFKSSLSEEDYLLTEKEINQKIKEITKKDLLTFNQVYNYYLKHSKEINNSVAPFLSAKDSLILSDLSELREYIRSEDRINKISETIFEYIPRPIKLDDIHDEIKLPLIKIKNKEFFLEPDIMLRSLLDEEIQAIAKKYTELIPYNNAFRGIEFVKFIDGPYALFDSSRRKIVMDPYAVKIGALTHFDSREKTPIQKDRWRNTEVKKNETFSEYLSRFIKEIIEHEANHKIKDIEQALMPKTKSKGKLVHKLQEQQWADREKMLFGKNSVLPKNEIALRVYEKELSLAKKEGKGKDYFLEEYKNQIEKNPKKADIVFDFLNEKGSIDIKFMFDMVTLKPLEQAMNKGIETGLKFAYEKLYGKQLMDSLKTILKKSETMNKVGRIFIPQYGLPKWYKDLALATERKIIKSQNVAEEMNKYLSQGLNQQEKIELHQAIIDGGNHPNKDIQARATVARHVLDDFGEQFFRVGAISRETFEANKGSYLARAYYSKELQKPLTEWLRNDKATKAGLERAKKRGIEKIYTEDKAQKLIKEGWQDRGEIKSRPGFRRVWRDFTVEERKQMNEITDLPEYLVAKTIKQVGYDVAILEQFAEIAKKHNLVKDNAFENFIKLPDTKNYGALKGKYVDPNIYRDIKGITDAPLIANQMSSRMLSQWKRWKVIWNPATHFRNMYFNVLLSDIAGLSLHRVDVYGSALVDMFKKSDDFKEARNLATFGSTWVDIELPQLKEFNNKTINQLMPDKNGIYEMNWKEILGNNIIEKFEKLNKHYDSFENELGNLYSSEEIWHKMALYKYFKYEKGMSPEEASKEARFWGQDYKAIPPAIRDFGQKWYGMPFISFQYVAARILSRAVVSRVATMAKWFLVFYLFQEEARKKLELTTEQLSDLKETFPQWMKEGFYLISPFKDKYNQYQFWDLSYIVPYIQDFKAKDPSNYFFQHPGMQFGSAIINNKDPFLGTEIHNPLIDDSASAWLESYAKYFYRQIVPPLFPGGYSYDKIMKSIYDKNNPPEYDARQIKTVTSSLVDSILGIKLRPINPEKETDWRLYELDQEYKKLDKELEKIEKGASPYIRMSDDEKRKKIFEISEAIKKVLLKESKIKELDITNFLESK